MSKAVKSVTISDGSAAAALKAKHPQRQGSSSSSASNVSSSPDLPRNSGSGLPANDSASSLNKLQKAPSRSDSGCSANGRVPCIPIPVNRPEMDMMCPLSPTGISLKAIRPPVVGDDPVSMYM